MSVEKWSVPGWRSRLIRRQNFRLLQLLIGLLAIAIFAGYQHYRRLHDTIPAALWGVWRTTNPQYADRFFAFEPKLVAIGEGDDSVSVQNVDQVEVKEEPPRSLYTIQCISYAGPDPVADKATVQWLFYYDPANGGSIRFRNQPDMEWRRGGPH